MMRLALTWMLFWVTTANAQDPGVQRALVQRDQQSAAFGLQLRQSQEALKVSPANRAAFDSRQLWDRQLLDNLGEKQSLEVKPELTEGLRSYERQKLETERLPFRYPIVEVPVQQPAPPPPLRPSLKGNVDLIEAPR